MKRPQRYSALKSPDSGSTFPTFIECGEVYKDPDNSARTFRIHCHHRNPKCLSGTAFSDIGHNVNEGNKRGCDS